MNDSDKATSLLEIYKLHTDLAEQTAASREGLNKLYTGMVSSIIAASVLIQRVAPAADAIWVLPVLGMVVSVCWLMSLHSITGRLSAKHVVLVELEAELPFRFLEREDRAFNRGGFVRRKWSAAAMPVLFLAMCLAWLVASTGLERSDGQAGAPAQDSVEDPHQPRSP